MWLKLLCERQRGGNAPAVLKVLRQSPLTVCQGLKNAITPFSLEQSAWFLHPQSEVTVPFTGKAPWGAMLWPHLCPPSWLDFSSKAFLIHSCFKRIHNAPCKSRFDRIVIYIRAAQCHWTFIQLSSFLIESHFPQTRRLSGEYHHYLSKLF